MLPGFNHNVRFNDRIYHVQTEDNGLKFASVVTQVFLAGQVLAFEKSSYEDLLNDGWEENDRVTQIRHRMQEQHKMLLKRVTQGAFEAQVDAFLSDPQAAQNVPPPDPSDALPPAASHDPRTTDALPAFAEASSLMPDERTMLIEETDFLQSLDAEVRRHIEASDPTLPPFDSSILPAEPPPILPRATAATRSAAPARTRRLRPPGPRDTLVDEPSPLAKSPRPGGGRNFGSAADGNTPPPRFGRSGSTSSGGHEQDELRRASAEMGLPMPEEPGHSDPNATLLELDAVALKAKLAEQRAKLKRASERAASKWSSPRPGTPASERVTVNERSLDEVLLSYLDDD